MGNRGFDTPGRNSRTAPRAGAPTSIAGSTTRRLTAALVLAGLLTAPATATARAAAPAAPVTPAASQAAADRLGRGTLVDFVELRTVTAGQARQELRDDRWDPGTVRDDVTMYRLVYRTVDATGRPTTATGLFALPANADRRLRVVSFTHGTELYRRDAPSTAEDTWGIAPALTFASAGFAATMPDYLGQGEGPGPHPWMDIPSETTASLDLLRAARSFADSRGRSLEREVYISGFSQGASAALGLARALRSGADAFFRVGAIAPISGAYDFRRAELPALLRGDLDEKASVIYASLLLVSYNRLHHVYDRPADVFQPLYANTIEGLLDGSHTPTEVLRGTPENIDGLLTGAGRALVERPTGAFAAALRETDSVCTNWRPGVPVRLYMAVDDQEAAPANTAYCRAALRAAGTDVRVTRFGPEVTHSDSNRLGTAAVVRWFHELG